MAARARQGVTRSQRSVPALLGALPDVASAVSARPPGIDDAHPCSPVTALSASTPSSAPSRLPVFYFAFAHLSLASSLALLGLQPESFAGFFYHARMFAAVHLVTLGWITAYILGALYMIAPMALRTRMRVTRLDWWSFWIFAIGVSGMVAHFWIEEQSGMVGAAAFVVFTLVVVAIRTLTALAPARLALGVKLHYWLAFANVLAAATLGILLGIHKMTPVLGGYVLTNVYAHLHLAAVGWAAMIVFGSGYRLLPMMLPAAPPPPSATLAGALLLETGVVGLAASLLAQSRLLLLFAGVTVAAVLWFLSLVAWMLRHPRPPSKSLPRPDFGRLHALQAILYLLLTTVVGMLLAVSPAAAWKLQLAPAYAVCGLLGFFGQMILGVSARQFPILAWIRTAQTSGPPPVPPHRLHWRRVAAGEFLLWSLGVPLLALGLALSRPELIAAGSWMLLGAVAASGMNMARVWRHPQLPRP